ncbi:hypothetical protein B0H63DRAFT_536343 [Podospora didyma]|uniref:F-box domain-containing protein n=1 Tax=Podospora didyma TaxID=330526 RepID=A0AAE0JYK5_9PEZI|nr:hypothetical protein B0H63DRAFT_536343 [Podospora didyma]
MVAEVSSLPAELALMIAKNLPLARDKSAFARTCRGLYNQLLQEFWRNHWHQALILDDSSLHVDLNETIIESPYMAWEPVHLAVALGHEEMVKYLISLKVDVLQSSAKGLYLDMDMDTDIEDTGTDTDADINGEINISAFINPYYHPTALHTAARNGKLDLIDLIKPLHLFFAPFLHQREYRPSDDSSA